MNPTGRLAAGLHLVLCLSPTSASGIRCPGFFVSRRSRLNCFVFANTVGKLPSIAQRGRSSEADCLRDDMVFNIRKRIRMSNFIAKTDRVELVGMKMQPKKLRSFAFSTSKNKKIFIARFSRERACFYDAFFDRVALHNCRLKKRQG